MRVKRKFHAALAGGIILPLVLGGASIANAEPQQLEAKESSISVSGTLAVVPTEDGSAAGTTAAETVLTTESGISVPLELPEVAALHSGQPVSARFALSESARLKVEKSAGSQASDERILALALQQNAPLQQMSADVDEVPEPRAGDSTYAHTIDVVYLEGAKHPFMSESTIRNEIAKVGAYWGTETEGRISSIKVNEVKFRRVPAGQLGADVCNGDGKKIREWAAQQYGLTRKDYMTNTTRKHLLIIESLSACGAVFGANAELGDGLNSAGTIWATFKRDDTHNWNYVLSHEFGHNLGLSHSNELDCTGGQIDTLRFDEKGVPSSKNCSVTSYYDAYDVMGGRYDYKGISKSQPIPASNVTDRIRLGVIEDADIVKLSNAGGKIQPATLRHSAAPVENGLTAIEITDPASQEKYYLEYRAGMLRDADAYYANWPSSYYSERELKRGVRVLRMVGKGSVALNRSGMSDTMAAKPGGNALVPGQAFTSFSGKVRVEVVKTEPSLADLCVFFDGAQKTMARPGGAKVSGTPKVGKTLSAVAGTREPATATLSYQWKRNGVNIAGAIGKNYVLKAADAKTSITVTVTAKNKCYTGGERTSTAVKVSAK